MYWHNAMHIIINIDNKCNKPKVWQLGNFQNRPWQNKGPKPDFNLRMMRVDPEFMLNLET